MSMYWQEEEAQSEPRVPDDVGDLAFAIRCPVLPIDHAQSLFAEVKRLLPWFDEISTHGIHTIHGAESGNGWERPEAEGSTIYLSRRTKLVLRLPKERLEAARHLEGTLLQIAGYSMEVGASSTRRLSASTTLYARHVAFGIKEESEEQFMQHAVSELRAGNFKFKKILCGKSHRIITESGPMLTRSLMVAELPLEDSVRLQQQGLGHARGLGCGLFIAHKPV